MKAAQLSSTPGRLDPPTDLDALVERARSAHQSGEWTQALELYEEAYRRAIHEGDAADIARLLRWSGQVHAERGEPEIAEELYDASLAIAEANRLDKDIVNVLSSRAALEQFGGQPDRAELLYERARSLAAHLGDDRLAATVDQNMGVLANMRGDMASALVSYTSALLCYRRLGDDRSATAALNNMGMAHLDLEDVEAAEVCFNQAFELASTTRDMFTLASVQLNKAELFLRRQQYEQARECCDEGFGIFTNIESKLGLADAYKFYGVLYRETGKPHLADIHLGLAWNLANGSGDRLLQAEVKHELARVHLDESRSLDAIRSLNQAHALYHEVQARREILDIEHQIDELEATYLRVVRHWGTETIETKDPYTLGHSERVADYTCKLAEAVGVGGRDLTWLRMGAFLHDVGKTVVPSSVLVKPGVLNESEWHLMKKHTVVGDEIVGGLDLPYNVRPMVRGHHERWDGHGYPDRLAGTDIPLPARILAVADVFDALTTARSYRHPFSKQEAQRILRHQAGRALDPELVDAFEEVVALTG